jgi:hypothetical protein
VDSLGSGTGRRIGWGGYRCSYFSFQELAMSKYDIVEWVAGLMLVAVLVAEYMGWLA